MAKQVAVDEFEDVFRRHKDMVFNTAYLILGDADEANDVLQEVFLKVHRFWHTYNPQKGGFQTWLHRVTVNQCISQRRKRRSPSSSLEILKEQGFDPADTVSQLPEELLIRQEESERIRRAMKSLDEKHRAVIVLRYFDDLSYHEIAHVLKIPLGTAKSRINAAIRALRKELT